MACIMDTFITTKALPEVEGDELGICALANKVKNIPGEIFKQHMIYFLCPLSHFLLRLIAHIRIWILK